MRVGVSTSEGASGQALEDKASNEHNEHKEASKPKVLSGAAGQDNAEGIVSYY